MLFSVIGSGLPSSLKLVLSLALKTWTKTVAVLLALPWIWWIVNEAASTS